MITKITAKNRGLGTKLRELWAGRELVALLAWRDFRVRYAQTLAGVAWAFFNPLLNLIILSFVFNRVAGLPTEGIPPLLYGAVGLLGWTFFAESMSKAGESLLANQNMVRKIYFPRLALPFSAVLSSVPDFLVSCLLVLVLMAWYGYFDPVHFWGFLPLLALLFVAALTAGIWVSALTIRFRDFRFVTPVFLRLGLFLVPIAYTVTDIPAAYQNVYFLNPVAGIIEGLKWCLLGLPLSTPKVWLGLPVLGLFFLLGFGLFSRVETKVADYL
ncbi:MAG: ABC transporter permease [Bacteroidota bacterium]